MTQLSVIIPARNEMWLSRTVEDVLAHSSDRTQVIVVLDGEWSDPGLAQHPRLDVIYHAQPIGQRAATNLAARVSSAPFIMKLDGHCAVAPGFDVALLEGAQALGVGVVQIPRQYNLHVFDWVCDACRLRKYQGPTPKVCVCGSPSFHRDVVWDAQRRKNDFYRFDSDLKFQYWGDLGKRPESTGPYPETMSCLGACWFLSRDWYRQLGGMDEDHGSWGQMGTELACKAWLSGGRMVTNRATWFSHLFRTQGGDFGFPYEMRGDDQEYARTYSRNLWRGNHWPGQIQPLRWLVDKFWPVPGWTEAQRDALPRQFNVGTLRDAVVVADGSGVGGSVDPVRVRTAPTAGLVYYTDGRLDPRIADTVRRQLESSGLPIVAVSLTDLTWPPARVLRVQAERGHLTMFRQILLGLAALETDYAFLVEHDVLYSEEHFAFIPPRDDTYYYNEHVWHVDAASGKALTYQAKRTSQLCANRRLLMTHYAKRVALVESRGFTMAMGFEPGSHGRPERVDDVPSDVWRTVVPNIDIRHRHNLTPSRWKREEFRSACNCQGWEEADGVLGWGKTRDRFSEFLEDLSRGDRRSVA